jgi:hypothetical protein
MPGLLIGREGPAAAPRALGCRGDDNYHDTMRAAPSALMEAVKRLKGRNDNTRHRPSNGLSWLSGRAITRSFTGGPALARPPLDGRQMCRCAWQAGAEPRLRPSRGRAPTEIANEETPQPHAISVVLSLHGPFPTIFPRHAQRLTRTPWTPAPATVRSS